MNALHLAWPWMLALLPLPVLLRALLAPAETDAALRVPRLPDGASLPARRRLPLLLAALAWLLLVLAAARPQLPDTAPPPASGRDLMLALDVSMSMATADLRLDGKTVERLQAARALADGFLARRDGDRVGLLVFGTQAYLHTPLSFDLRAVRDALASAQVGLAGRDTALGDAIALAVKHLKALPDSARVLVLLTDGASTAGTLAPARAAWLAQRENVRIHAIGIGASSDLDETTLREITAQTGGSYARAADGAALAQFLNRIDALETIQPARPGSTLRELYAWPLALALACALAAWRLREAAA
jgi:Ca-activated chloride channel homolog